MRKTVALTLFLFCAFTAFAQWKTLSNWGIGREGRSVAAYQNVLYAVEHAGLYRSTDGGAHWEKFNTVPYPNCEKMAITDDGVIFLIAPDAQYHLLVSHDLGLSWEDQPMPDNYFPTYPFMAAGQYVYFLHPSYGLYRRHQNDPVWTQDDEIPASVTYIRRKGSDLWVSYFDSFYRSSDFGDSWAKFTPNAVNPSFFRFEIKNDIILGIWEDVYNFTVGWRSGNSGASWQQVALPDTILHLYATENHFYAISKTGELYRSADALNWEYLLSSSPLYYTGIAQSGNNVVFAHSGGILRSADGGATWSFANTGLSAGNNHVAHRPAGAYLLASGRSFSNDGGENWLTPAAPFEVFTDFYSQQGKWFGKTGSGLYRSDGNFLKWTHVPSSWPDGGMPFINSFVQLGDTLVGSTNTVGSLFRIYRSVDGGATWTGTYNDAKFITLLAAHQGEVIAMRAPGQTNEFIVSNDYGATWTSFANGAYDGTFNTNYQSAEGKLYTLRTLPNQYPHVFCSDDVGQNWVSLTDSLEKLLPLGFGLRDFRVYMGRLFVLANYYTENEDRIYVSGDQGKTWADFSSGIDGAKVDVGQLFFWNEHLCFTNLKNGELWLRALNDIDRNPAPGSAFFDANKNGLSDNQEKGMPYLSVRSNPGNALTATDAQGNFLLLDAQPDDTVRVTVPFPYMQTVPPYFLGQNAGPRDFALQWKADFKDLRVQLTESADFISGRKTKVYARLYNDGTDTLSGVLQLVFSDNIQLLDTSPDSLSLNGSLLQWTYTDLKPFENRLYVATFEGKLPPIDPVIGMIARAFVLNDTTPLNNNDTLSNILRFAYDPNDKFVNRTQLTPEQVSQSPQLEYRIRFQNTGNYPAFRVRLLDTLSQWVDPASLRVLNASHPYALILRENHLVEFIFDDINLPDSTANEPNSHGFVTYALHTRNDVPLDSIIRNTAYIFFDFNAPVVTNTVQTAIVKFVRTLQPERRLLRLAPNPARDRLRLLDPETMQGARLEIYNNQGQILRSLRLTNPADDIDLSDLPPGTYYLFCKEKTQVRVGKLLKH